MGFLEGLFVIAKDVHGCWVPVSHCGGHHDSATGTRKETGFMYALLNLSCMDALFIHCDVFIKIVCSTSHPSKSFAVPATVV
jgi:hypothetical protein